MKIQILCSLIVSLFSYFVYEVNGASNGLNLSSLQVLQGLQGFQGLQGLPGLQMPSLSFPSGLSFPSAAPIVPTRQFGYPRKQLPFLPVPVVKKVTHHHIHHVIAHKGVVKSKYSNEANNGFDLDNKDNDNKNTNQLNYKTYKEDLGLQGDFNDNGFKSSFHKRGGGQQLGSQLGFQMGSQHLGDLMAQSSGHNKGIRGYIGGQKAEFVPLIIGIIDDGSDLVTGLDSNKEYSSRKGLLRSDAKRREYIPPKETLKLFEDLAKLGFK